jgi:hypothetical protein
MPTTQKRRRTDLSEPIPGSSTEYGDEIARRAYELYQERGGEDGHDVDDWLQAERELTASPIESEL